MATERLTRDDLEMLRAWLIGADFPMAPVAGRLVAEIARLRAENAEGALTRSRMLNVIRGLEEDNERLEAEITRLQVSNDRRWAMAEEARAEVERLREAVREACLHQGLPEDAPPERVTAHFRNNREMREGFDALAPEGATDGD